jgi:signal recognition particle subunit SRP54
MFQDLSGKFEDIFKKIRGQGKISEKHLDEAMREIRRILLEADVNFKVARDFVKAVSAKALGAEVVKSITPAQQIVKIVNDELTALLGGREAPLKTANIPPTVIMVMGLQGAGKTTLCGKLALHLKSQNKSPLLIGADLQRPAAVEQLHVVARQAGVKSYSDLSSTPLEVCKQGFAEARKNVHDTIILDTAGRLAVDDQLMHELAQIRDELKPHEILFVADAMTGQDAVGTASTFLEKIDFDGIVLTKMDGDARGGAAISMKTVTGKPIKYISTGEKLSALEKFHPDRMASRILGMGDIVSLVEKAQENVDVEKAKKLEKKLRRAEFTFEDFFDQLQQIKKMGPLSQILGMLPGMNGAAMKDVQIDDKALVRVEAIINSMTFEERRRPQILNGSRRARIARGSGTTVQEINRLVKQFSGMQKMMKQFSKKGKRGRGAVPRFPF